MSIKRFKSFLCAAAVGACGVFGTPAHGTAFYDGSWDPLLFRGAFEVSIDNACIALAPGTYTVNHSGTCNLQLVFLDFFDSAGREWNASLIPDPIGFQVLIAGGELVAFAADVSNLRQVGGIPNRCDGTRLIFALTGRVEFSCGGFGTDVSATGYLPLIRDPPGDDTDGEPAIPGSVPEPATLALLGVGLAGLAASRRRKPL